MSASFGLGRFREINTSKTVLRRYRAAETAEAMSSRGRPHGGRLKARIAHRRFIFLNVSVSGLYYSTLPHPTQQNFYFVALGKRTEKRTNNSRVRFGHFGYRIFWCHFPCFYTDSWEPLNQSAAALSGPFAPTDRFENLEIRKGFLRFPNLNLEQNPSLTTLAIESEVPYNYCSNQLPSFASVRMPRLEFARLCRMRPSALRSRTIS